ncbi:MAG: thiamine pyrophosphate-dependent dehydrogenase E1 component subunit alpha [Gemmatimonadota bacterium]
MATVTGTPPPDVARQMLRSILRIRMVEERIRDLYADQEMRCPTHFSIGQEAVAVGVCAHLRRDEQVTSAHRSHAHYLAKGGDLQAMLAELYGKATGCASGKGGSMHLIDEAAGFLGAVPIVGSTIPIGVGAALASVLQGSPVLAVIFFGDAATETGVFHESLNFAALHRLPVVMVCENNLYSVLSPLSCRHPEGRAITQLAQGHGVWNRHGDGNDAEAVHALAGEAIAHARAGRGPAFLEFKTYRRLEHCGPLEDRHLGYRKPGEYEAWMARDPLKLYSQRLRARELVTSADLETMAREIAVEVEDAVTFARSSPFPTREQLAAHVYAP